MVEQNQEKKKVNLQKPSGTMDFLPEEMSKRIWLNQKIQESFSRYGLEQIDIPMYDFFELYKKRSGEKIINDIFTFYDPPKHRAEENPALYALRPEFTAPLVRFYITSELMYRPKPLKLFYIGPCFRYDEPKKGRYRQFTQAGVEIFGADTATADAEILLISMNLMKELGIENYLLRINDLTFLRAFLQENNIQSDKQKKIFGIVDNITSLLRKLEIGALEEISSQDLIGDYYSQMNEEKIDITLTKILENLLHIVGSSTESIDQLQKIFKEYPLTLQAIRDTKMGEVCDLIESAGIKKYVVDCGIARGLDYYTNIVFEIDVPSLGKEKQVCGGGRYNSMVEDFGGESTPSLGFSFGFERLLISLENQNYFQQESPRSELFIGTKSETRIYGMQIAQKLREQGIKVELDIMDRSFKSASKMVNKLKIPYMMFLGPREQESSNYTLKNFNTKEQKNEISIEEVMKIIKDSRKD